jgi:hypothetical protein
MKAGPQMRQPVQKSDTNLDNHISNTDLVISKVVSLAKPSPPGAIARAVKAALNNDRVVSKIQRSGDPLPPITSDLGRTIRDDAVNRHSAEDTNQRQMVPFDVAEAAGGLRSEKTRTPTRDEIEQVTQKNARGAESIVGVMRAQRLIRKGKL